MTIVGVGVVAALQLVATGTAANVDGAAGTTGVNLARNVREMTLGLSFAQTRALNGGTFNPPIDSRGITLSDFPEWTQAVTVRSVSPDRLTLNTIDASPTAVRVTVSVSRNGQHVTDLSWYRFRPGP